MDDVFRRRLARAAAGDEAALAGLLSQHYEGLLAFVRLKAGRLVRARETSLDLVQSVCREVIQEVAVLDCADEAGFRRWLYTVALNKILRKKSHHVAQRRDAARDVPLESDALAGVLAAYASFCSPSRDVAAREEVARVEAAFQALPEEYRDVIIDARLMGRSHREIAADSGKTEAAVRKLLSRARARLAVLLAG